LCDRRCARRARRVAARRRRRLWHRRCTPGDVRQGRAHVRRLRGLSARVRVARAEELLASLIARLIADARHVAVGAASPIPATACELLRAKGAPIRVTRLHKRAGNPFTEGSRELFDLAGQGRIDYFFLGGAQLDGEANINLVRAEGRRFPGSFGSAFMYFTCRTILFRDEHSPRVLVPTVEFVSALGWSPPEVARRGGPVALLTAKALFAWDRERR